jgi:hypothetical protein
VRGPRAAILAVLAVASNVGGCRIDEQGRPLQFEPGKYHGAADEKLDTRTEQQLQQRGGLMR